MDRIYMVTVEHLHQFYPEEVKRYGIEILYDLANGHTLYQTPIYEVSPIDLQKHIRFQSDFALIRKLRCDYEATIDSNNIFHRIVHQLKESSCNRDINEEDIEETAIRAKESIIPTGNREIIYQEISQYMQGICASAERNSSPERSL